MAVPSMRPAVVAVALLLACAYPYAAAGERAKLRVVAANTATETGLIKALGEAFAKSQPGAEVNIEPVGALATLQRAREGRADIVITHHPEGEALFVNEGYGLLRTSVMYNEFIIVGPTSDPLRLSQERDLIKVMRRLAEKQVDFYASGARSGTTAKLNRLWAMAGIEPGWPGYQTMDSSAASVLEAAALYEGYTLVDIGTYIARRGSLRGAVTPLYRDHALLRNYYSAIVVNHEVVPGVNQALAESFLEYLVSDDGQRLIRDYGIDMYGAGVFTPAAQYDDGLRARRMQVELDEQRRRFRQAVVMSVLLVTMLGMTILLLRRARKSEQQRRASEERFAMAVSGSNDGIWDIDVLRDAGFFSDRCLEILGCPPGQTAVNSPKSVFLSRVHPADRVRVQSRLDSCLASIPGNESFDIEFRIAGNDERWAQLRGKASPDKSNDLRRISGSITDITERKRQAAIIEHQALHDALTNLPNRALLSDRLEHALRLASANGGSTSLLILDLNRFKDINDTLGHNIGDLLLQHVSERLRKMLRPMDTVARLGGDEFAIVLPDAEEVYARHVAQKILLVLNKPADIGNHTLYVGGSIGIARYPEHGADPQTLLQHADVAMYQAKRAETGLAVYNPSKDRNTAMRLSLEMDLREAIDNDTLELHYQPKYSLSNGAMVGVEALLRWMHPKHGPISPSVMIPMAEQTGLIKALSLWITNASLYQAAEWRRSGLDTTISINISVWNLQDPSFMDQLRLALKTWSVPPERLEIEITESAMMSDPERALATLNALAAMGVRLSIDDFGTGYSSLAYLYRLPVDSIKIDKSFITNMQADSDNAKIVRSTVELAHNLGMTVVAEGVESATVASQLTSVGCDFVQGFHYSHPIPAAHVLRVYQERAVATASAARRVYRS